MIQLHVLIRKTTFRRLRKQVRKRLWAGQVGKIILLSYITEDEALLLKGVGPFFPLSATVSIRIVILCHQVSLQFIHLHIYVLMAFTTESLAAHGEKIAALLARELPTIQLGGCVCIRARGWRRLRSLVGGACYV